MKFVHPASHGQGHKKSLHAKPGLDPRQPEQTRFLSEEKIIMVAYSPSKVWVECRTPREGVGQGFLPGQIAKLRQL